MVGSWFVLDVKGKKIGFIISDSNNIMYNKIKDKVKKLKKLNADVCVITKPNTKQDILSIIDTIQFYDVIVIVPCSR